jgi:hypothetical protein
MPNGRARSSRAIRLQRRYSDRDLRAGARSRLAVSGKACAAEGHAGAVGRRSAEEDALGERAIMADGNDYNLVLLKDQGKPVEVYAAEGSPLIIVPCGIFRGAPNPNAAKLFQSFFSAPKPSKCWWMCLAHRSFRRAGEGEGGASRWPS